jgi:hypothetical protein
MTEKDFETIEDKCDHCKKPSKNLVSTLSRPDHKVCKECLPNQISIE